jgi:hypothetical protein
VHCHRHQSCRAAGAVAVLATGQERKEKGCRGVWCGEGIRAVSLVSQGSSPAVSSSRLGRRRRARWREQRKGKELVGPFFLALGLGSARVEREKRRGSERAVGPQLQPRPTQAGLREKRARQESGLHVSVGPDRENVRRRFFFFSIL